MNPIGNTIAHYPEAVQLPDESGQGWRTVSWADFADANPEIADDVALQIAIHGRAVAGGGAFAETVILRGRL